jgi:hypothetical protein
MARGKFPGFDRITVELYKCMQPVFEEEYLCMLLKSIERQSLPCGVTEGLVALLHKGKGHDTLNNWRPITQLNVSYKLFAKVL